MPAERMNYCQALGLNPFNEEAFDPAESDSIIEAKKAEWETKLQTRPSAHTNWQYNKLIESIPDIRAVLRNEVLRHAEFENARRIVSAKASHLRRCTVTSRTGECDVIPSLAAKVLKHMLWDGIGVKDLINASGIYHTELKDAATAQVVSVYNALRDMGCYTPEEFINTVLGISGLNFSTNSIDEDSGTNIYFETIDEIYGKRDRLSRLEVPGWEAYNSTVVKLHSIRTASEVSAVRKYGKTMQALEPVLDILDQDSGVGFSAEYTDNLISTMLDDVPDKELAVRILENYCFEHGYPANFSVKESKLSLCPSCKALTPIADGAACACAYCGFPVRVKCPVCGMVQSSTGSMCSGCRTPFAESSAKVAELVETAEQALARGDTETASKAVSEIRSGYPHHDSEALEAETARVTEALSSIRDESSAMFRGRRYHSLKSLIDAALPDFPFLSDDTETGPRYAKACEAVAEADRLCVSASKEEDYIEAAEVCPDHPEALAALSVRPPMGPADGNAEMHADGIVVSYSVPADRRGMVFCIYRGIGQLPEVNSETVPTVETDKGIWLDTSAEPGAPCYYRIHSRRWGVLSEEFAEAGPCVLVREVTNVTLTPIEDGIRAEYTKPDKCTRIRVWRKMSGYAAGTGEEVEIPAGDTGFEDRGLRGNESYVYLFVAEYEGGFRSSGTVFRAETLPYPDPVTDLAVSWDRKTGLYTAEWGSDSEVRLYFSETRHEFPGRITPMVDIDSWMTEIEPQSKEEDRAVFRLPTGSSGFLTPIITAGTVGIVGDCVLIANLRPISGITRVNQEDGILLRFPWPTGAIGATAVANKTQIPVIRKPGESEGAVLLKLAGASNCPVKLFAVYDVSGQRMMSNAVTANIWSESFRKITYTVSSAPARNDRTRAEIQVTIACPDAGNIPCCIMVRSEDGIPLKATDGETVWRSDNPILLGNGIAKGAFFLPKDEADIEHMRLFLADRSDYSRFRIIHPLYRRD